MFIPHDIYATIVDCTVIPTVDILLLDSNKKILLGLRKNAPLQGVYYLPGGRIHKGETMIQSVMRKSKEEVGINIDTTRLQFVGVYDDIFDDSTFVDISTHCLPCTFVYRCTDTEIASISIDPQHSDMNFCAFDDSSLHPFLQERLLHIQEGYRVF